MFGNRVLQVRFVKTEKKNTVQEAPAEDTVVKLVYVNEMTKSLMREAAKAAVAYVVIDTVRQVVVARAIRR